jgi:hypothetical protein
LHSGSELAVRLAGQVVACDFNGRMDCVPIADAFALAVGKPAAHEPRAIAKRRTGYSAHRGGVSCE